MNWKAQTLPVILLGLPHAMEAAEDDKSTIDWSALPQPSLTDIERCSALAQVKSGNYTTPTFLVHGTADELIPWQQSHKTWRALVDHGVEAGLALVEQAPHICDTSRNPESTGWKAVLQGYDFLVNQ